MSKPEYSPNPYAAPDLGYVPVSNDVRVAGRPGWYTFFCVIAIIMGALGVANALLGTVMLFAADSLQQAFQGPPPPGLGTDFVELQNEMNAEMLAVTHRYFWFLLTSQILLAFVAVGLVSGGTRALGMIRSGARLLSTMFLVTSVFEVARLVLTIFIQIETNQVGQKFVAPLMEKAASAQGGNGLPPGMSQVFASIMPIATGVGICFLVGWVIVKLAIYLSGWVYLNKPHVQSMLKD
jgi:hypothetical protein